MSRGGAHPPSAQRRGWAFGTMKGAVGKSKSGPAASRGGGLLLRPEAPATAASCFLQLMFPSLG